MFQKVTSRFIDWLTREEVDPSFPLSDFERIRYEVRPGDVLLIEGRSRISEVIRQITQSPWTHACLYIGRLYDIDDLAQREKLAKYFTGDPNVQLVIEGYVGKGTIASPLDSYKGAHVRICRPSGLSRQDAQKVVAFSINKLGSEYDVRQIFDLARFLVPWSILPRRWRSSLFEHHIGVSTRTVCSTMIAEGFASIDFPILPVVKQHEETGIELFARNPRLFTPRDFDYSPYFDIIKYPFVSFSDSPYRSLPWNREGLYSADGENIIDPSKPKESRLKKFKSKKEKKKGKEPVLPSEENKGQKENTSEENKTSDNSSHTLNNTSLDFFSLLTNRFSS